MAQETVLDTLQMMAAVGVATFPLRPNDKKPAIKEWQKCEVDCSADAINYYNAHPDSNIAILCGAASGNLFVIDIDTHDADGFAYLRKWEEEHGELPETVTTKTGSNGTHMLYRAAGKISTGANGDLGIDVRGEGGYIVAPPSIHPNGQRYEWENHPEDFDIAVADENVMAFLKSIQRGAAAHGNHKAKFNLPEKIMRGERDDILFRYACSMQSGGYGDDDISTLVHIANELRCVPPLSKQEVDAKVSQALKYEKGKSIDPCELAKRDGSTRARLILTSKGEPKQTVDNGIRVLMEDTDVAGRFAYNTMAFTRMAKDPLPWTQDATGWRKLRDSDYSELTAWMEYRYGLSVKNKIVDSVLAVCERNKVNPVVEWLESLEWDGQERIAHALECCIGCNATEYTRAVSSLIFLGGVARAVRGGCKFDYMVVLVGKQGEGKSTFISRLSPNSDWLLDGLDTFDDDKAIEKIRGKWIIEVAELAAFKSFKGIEKIKSFVSTRIDTIRAPYGRESEDRPRHSILIGTTNDESFLVDKTGNRRFLPVRVMQRNPEFSVFEKEICEDFIEQCWAEAYAKNKDCKLSLVMPKHLEEQVESAQLEFTEEDPSVGMIGAFLDEIRSNPTLNNKRVCAVQIAVEVFGFDKKELNKSKRITNEINAIIRENFGNEWVQSKHSKTIENYGKQRVYEPRMATNMEFHAELVE